jgi:hypothetical protein
MSNKEGIMRPAEMSSAVQMKERTMKECGFSICAELMRGALGYHLRTAQRQSATKTLSRLTDCHTTIGLTDRQQ